jgi:hypothetical protein
MDNFLAKPVGTNLVLAFVQHESGPQCTSLIDKPFSANLNECLRYYCKSYNYSTLPGTASAPGWVDFSIFTGLGTSPGGLCPFPVPLAKSPSVVAYNFAGAINSCTNVSTSTVVAVSSVSSNERSINELTIGTAQTVGNMIRFQFTADTGW